jgi:hypothetical protein
MYGLNNRIALHTLLNFLALASSPFPLRWSNSFTLLDSLTAVHMAAYCKDLDSLCSNLDRPAELGGERRCEVDGAFPREYAAFDVFM